MIYDQSEEAKKVLLFWKSDRGLWPERSGYRSGGSLCIV